MDTYRHDELEADLAQYYHIDLERMGDEFSHAHAACLATQLPKGSRCKAADDPHDEWDETGWALWHIERSVNLVRWGLGIRYEGEETPKPLPYPGQERDNEIRKIRFQVNKMTVDDVLGMNGDAYD